MKLVRESINFERGVNPKNAMGIAQEARAKAEIYKTLDKLSEKFKIYDISDERIYPEPYNESLVHFKHSNTRYFLYNTFDANFDESWRVGFWFHQGSKINWMIDEEADRLDFCTHTLFNWFETFEIP